METTWKTKEQFNCCDWFYYRTRGYWQAKRIKGVWFYKF